PNVTKLATGTASCIHQGNLDRSLVTAASTFIAYLMGVILSEAKNLGLNASPASRKWTEMFESLASCYTFRCSASLNMTARSSVVLLPLAYFCSATAFFSRQGASGSARFGASWSG